MLNGGAGNDVLAGDDVAGPDGADDFLAGSGNDTVTYATRTDNLNLDSAANDRASGELDDISSSFDNLIGGGGDDNLFGNALANVLDAGGGDDVLAGGEGTGARRRRHLHRRQ